MAPLFFVSPAQVVLKLYGAGLRGRSNLNAVNLAIANTTLTAGYAGVTGLAGLDQINALLPNSLAGSGKCNLTLTVNGKTANVVKLMLKLRVLDKNRRMECSLPAEFLQCENSV
jgi:hypothetical protein